MASVRASRTTLSHLLLLVLVLLHGVTARVYKKCELARELKHRHGLPDGQIATWVCIAKHESNYDTAAVNRGSGDHGLFQISDVYWCSPPGSGYACNRPCSAFEDDDIADDVVCIRRIFKEHQRISGDGFNAWVVYPLYCKGDVTSYTAGCFDGIVGEEELDHSFNVTTEKPAGGEEYEDLYEFPPLPVFPKIQDTFTNNFSDGNDLEANFSYPSYPQEVEPSTRDDGGFSTQKESAFEGTGARTGSGFGGNGGITIKYYRIEKEPAFQNLGTTTGSGFEGNRQNFYDDVTTKKYQIQEEPSLKDTTGLGLEEKFYDDTATKNYHIQEEPSFKDSGTTPDSSLNGNNQNFYEDPTTKTYQNKDDFHQYLYKDDSTQKPINHEDSFQNVNRLTTTETFRNYVDYSNKDVTTKKYQTPNTFNNYYDKTTKTEKPQFQDTFLPNFGDHTTRKYFTLQKNPVSTTEEPEHHKFHPPSHQEITTKEPFKTKTYYQSTKPTVKKPDDATAASSPLDVDSTKAYKKGRTRPFRFTTFKPFTFRSLTSATTKTYEKSTTVQEATSPSTTSRKYDQTSEKSNTFQESNASTPPSSTTTKKHDYYTKTQKHTVPFTFKPLPPLNLPRPGSFRPLPTRKPLTFKPFTTRRPLPVKPFTAKLPISFKPFTTRPFAKPTSAGRSLSTFKSTSTRASLKPFTLKPFTLFTKKYHASDKKLNVTSKTTTDISLDTTTTSAPSIHSKSTKTQFLSTQKPLTTTTKPPSTSPTTRRPFSTIFPTRKFTNKNTSSATTTSEAPSASSETKYFKEVPKRKESTKKPSSRQSQDNSKMAPHQTFYGSADELQYNFFTKTYGFKLVGQF